MRTTIRTICLTSALLSALPVGACQPGASLAGATPTADGLDDDTIDAVGSFDGPACARGLERFFTSYERTADAADDVVPDGLWTSPRSAAGGGEIQMSWEYEVMSTDRVPSWYRPATMSTEEWDSLPTWRQLSAMRSPGVELVRRDDAPAWIREVLKREGAGAYETTARSYVSTLDDLYRQAGEVQSTMGADGGFHFHVSFQWNEAMQPHAHQVRALLQRGNEYTTYRWLTSNRNWDNLVIRPMRASVLDDIERALAEGSTTMSHKFAPIGMRTGIYGEAGRVGFELRSVNHEVDDATRIIESISRGVEDPGTALVKFGSEGAAYRLSTLEVGDWVGPSSFARLPEDVQVFFRDARAAARFDELSLQSWSLPMVSLEARPQIPVEAGRVVVAERVAFLDAIRDIMRASAGGPVPESAARMIQSAVSDFCRATAVAWEHL